MTARGAGLLALCALALAAFAGPSAGSPDASARCKPGVRKIGGTSVRVFCGPAKATLRLGGRTYRFANGRCYPSEAGLVVAIGILARDASSAPKFKAFFLSAPALRDGTYRNVVIRWELPRRRGFFEKSTLVISGKRSRGTFSGRAFPPGRGSGSFTCG